MFDQKTQEQRIEFQKKMVACQVWATCFNCENWIPNQSSAGPDGCAKAGGAVPPPTVMVYGCPLWLGDIPF